MKGEIPLDTFDPGLELSVVIPCYNVERWIADCVNSLRSNPTDAIEILVVDDGSTDSTVAICQAIAQEDNRVKIVCQNHVGDPSFVRNVGLDHVGGRYIWFVDSDDHVTDDAVETLLSIIRRSEPDVIRVGQHRYFPDGRESFQTYHYPDGLYAGENTAPIRLDAICSAHALDYSNPRLQSACAAVCSRAFLRKNQIRFVSEREIINEDFLYVLQITYAAQTIYICNQLLYCYVRRPGSLSLAPRPNMFQRKMALWQYYIRPLPKDDQEVAVRLGNFYIDCIYACFTEVCMHSSSWWEAVPQIRSLLRDKQLQQYLWRGPCAIRGWKPRCICMLMRLRLASAMFILYKLMDPPQIH